MNPNVHFEMPFDDSVRIARFDQQAFGWHMQPLGSGLGDCCVAETGGRVQGEPLLIPGVGSHVSFFDTEGNRVGLLQPLPRS